MNLRLSDKKNKSKKSNIYLCRYLLLVIIIIIPCQLFSQTNPPGGFGGVGMQITLKDGQIYVLSVLPDSPAERMGIHSGDVITQINGEPTANTSLDKIVSKIRGPEGTNVNFRLKRSENNQEQELEVSLNRGFIVANVPTTTRIISTTGRPFSPTEEKGVGDAQPTIYFIPLSCQISPGSSFVLEIIVDNPKGILADEFALWIQYDPKAITVKTKKDKGGFESDGKLLSDWSVVSAFSHPSTGELFVWMKNPDPKNPLSGVMGKIEFEATGNVPFSKAQFGFNSWGTLPNTFMTYKKKDILGNKLDPKDGTIGSTIRIYRQADTTSEGHPRG